MNKEKMMKIAKGLSIFAKIISILLMVAMIMIAVGAIIVAVVDVSSFVNYETSISVGNVTIELAEAVAKNFTLNKPQLLITLLLAFLTVALIWYELKVAREILEPMKEGNPFTTSIAPKIRTLARIELFGNLFLLLVSNITNHFLNYDLAIMDLFKEGVVKNVSVNQSFSLNFLIIAFILYLLSYVFEYGEELQKESDETL